MDVFILDRVIGVIVAACSLVVLYGHLMNLPSLIQVLPVWAPMQGNTALGLGSLGLAIATRWRWFALMAAVVGWAAVLRYALGVEIGLTEALIKHTVTVETVEPGLMAPGTAAALMAGAAYEISRSWVVRACSTMVVAASSLPVLVGYAFGFAGLVRFDLAVSGMAFHTAGLLALVVGAQLWRLAPQNQSRAVSL